MKYPCCAAVATLLCLCAAPAQAKEFVVSQKDKAFSVKSLNLKVGDTVVFKNDDPFFHNIFSLSEVHTFDIGSFPKGESRKVTFDKEGKIEVECAIHPDMKLLIEVRK